MIPFLVGQYKSQERLEPSIMSESDTMFNTRDRRCTAVQLMLSTDPSYVNRTIASTLKMQIWIATNNRNVPRVVKTKFPAMVMVFSVVSSEGYIMPSHIFKVGLKVNTKVYLDVLKSVVMPWCNRVAGGRPWVWKQDSVPAHKSKETQAWFQKECNDFVPFSHWPPSSPDLNPLDYFVLSYVENITNMTSHNTKASLIAAIHRVFAELLLVQVKKACSQFPICIEAVDWDWRQLHWIDVSSTTSSSYLNWFFQ